MSALTPEELADRLNLPLAWIKRGVRNRTLPHERYGRYARFTEEQVEQIRTAHRVDAKTTPSNPYGRKTRGAK